MDNATIKRLNKINREFYRATANSFDESRGRAWPGWKKLLTELHEPLSVLDVGCGNGRLGLFLLRKLSRNVTYYGLDNNPILLQHARDAFEKEFPTSNYRFDELDIVEHPEQLSEIREQFGLVMLSGVIHHIPGEQQRRTLMKLLADRVAPRGLLVFTSWCFYEFERFRERIIPWPSDLQPEIHDYLLDWRRGLEALRYCHYVDEEENNRLSEASGLLPVSIFRADGHTDDINRYTLLRKSV